MGGFYFQGEQGQIDWHEPGCGAVVNGQRRYDLDLRDLGDRWDVLLDGGQRFGPGEITYVFTYFTDYAAIGHLAKTTSQELGELVVFNWAPVQWDEALEHETILVRWPIEVPKSELSLDEVTELGLRTESFVNEDYKLSYLGRRGTAVSPPVEPAEGPRYLVVRAHRDNLDVKEKFQLTYYVPAEFFPNTPLRARAGRAQDVPAAAPEEPVRGRPRVGGQGVMLLAVGGLLIIGFVAVVIKHEDVAARAIVGLVDERVARLATIAGVAEVIDGLDLVGDDAGATLWHPIGPVARGRGHAGLANRFAIGLAATQNRRFAFRHGLAGKRSVAIRMPATHGVVGQLQPRNRTVRFRLELIAERENGQ